MHCLIGVKGDLDDRFNQNLDCDVICAEVRELRPSAAGDAPMERLRSMARAWPAMARPWPTHGPPWPAHGPPVTRP